ncbi:MAG: hypothetical protein AB4368_04840 [Xenococcaceae cyanobacterium]
MKNIRELTLMSIIDDWDFSYPNSLDCKYGRKNDRYFRYQMKFASEFIAESL